jgi:hypothetical protein
MGIPTRALKGQGCLKPVASDGKVALVQRDFHLGRVAIAAARITCPTGVS